MTIAAFFTTWPEDDSGDITAKPMLITTKTTIIPRKMEYFADDETIQKVLGQQDIIVC